MKPTLPTFAVLAVLFTLLQLVFPFLSTASEGKSPHNPPFFPKESYRIPEETYSGWRNSYSIHETFLFPANGYELSREAKIRIKEIMDTIYQHPQRPKTLTLINVIGLSSPEGPRDYNMQLAEKRRALTVEYINSLYVIPEGKLDSWSRVSSLRELFNISYQRKNEGGYMKQLNDHYEHFQCLDIAAGKITEDEAMQINYKNYPELMREEFYPNMRAVELEFYFQDRDLLPEDIYAMGGKLNQPFTWWEYYQAAMEYPEFSIERNRIISQWDNNTRGNHVALIARAAFEIAISTQPRYSNNYKHARTVLDGTRRLTAEWYNNYGCVLVYDNDLEHAREYFTIAEREGCTIATENLQMLEQYLNLGGEIIAR